LNNDQRLETIGGLNLDDWFQLRMYGPS
jgi:hypothetical protein